MPADGVFELITYLAFAAAAQFSKKIEDVRMELFVLHLQFRGENEQVVVNVLVTEAYQKLECSTDSIHTGWPRTCILSCITFPTPRF